MNRLSQYCISTLICSLCFGNLAFANISEEDYSPLNEVELENFVEARLLEINNDDRSALKRYNILFAKQNDSQILADRLFNISWRQGDIETALKVIKANDDNGASPAQAYILQYSDALKRKKWEAASSSLVGLKGHPIFGFMVPIMKSWIDTGRGNDGTVFLRNFDNSGLTNFYARDQIIYQYLIQKKFTKVQKAIVSVRPFNEALARDLILKSASILAKNGEVGFAKALLEAQGSGAALSLLSVIKGKKAAPEYANKISPEIGVARLYTRISDTLVGQELYEQALFFARVGQWLAPNDPVVLMQLARSLNAQGQDDLASKILNDLEDTDPYYSLFSSQNIRISLDNDNNERAIEVAVNANKRQPNSRVILLLLAQTYDGVKQYDNAIKTYERLLRVSPKNETLRNSYYRLYLARSLTRSGKWKKAKKVLETGLQLESENPFLLNYYGYSLLERGEDIKKGVSLVKRAYKLRPSSPDISDSLGWAYFLQGNFKKAIPLLERAAREADQDSEIQEHLGDVYWTVGRLIDARYIWRAASLIANDDDKDRLDHKAEYGLDVPYARPQI